MFSKKIKRSLDFLAALLLLVLLSPIMAVSALLILLCMGRPILFIQNRPGYKERPFRLVKFRTMHISDANEEQSLSDTERLTKLGRILRKTSIDELPQLWNVLKGEMSLVGPRPLLMRYLPYYSNQERRRHDCLPGITGWAQVSGRNDLDWDARLACDVWYVDNWSLVLDAKIMIKTLGAVLFSKGVQTDPGAVREDLDAARTKKANQHERT